MFTNSSSFLLSHSFVVIAKVSHDKSIIFWNPEDGSVVRKHENAHEGPISCLTVTPTGLIVTGSWDNTAKVWNSEATQCIHHLKGHEMNVLCVLGLPNGGDIVTGCGDGTIKIWRDGREIRTIRAHTTCVRGLSVLPNVGFLSCANDGMVKLWSFDGNEIHSLQAHNTLCYAIVADSTSSSTFFTCSEDNTIKVWQDFNCVQTIPHPNTVWDVAILPNGDFVTACADNRSRVFTKDARRVASEETLTSFKHEVEKSRKKTQQVNVDELPSVTVLTTEIGKKDGEVKVVNEGGVGNAYQWDMRAQQWQLIGEVVGGPSVGENLVGKECLNGKFYDHVFDVELDDGRSYKIGFNEGDNPYEAAQEFIHQNNLPQYHMETIAKFIIQNFGGDEAAGRSIAPQRIVDPWNMSPSSATVPQQQYQQRSTVQGEHERQKLIRHFPCGYSVLETANLSGIMKKIKEFNGQQQSNMALSHQEEHTLDTLIEQLQRSDNRKLEQEHLLVLEKLLAWPSKNVFPVLDLARIVILVDSAAEYYAKKSRERGRNIVSTVLDIGFLNNNSNNVILQMMALRFMGNVFQHDGLRAVLVQSVDSILNAIVPVNEKSKDDKLRVPYARLLQNLMVHYGNNVPQDDDPMKDRLIELAKSFLTANDGQLNAETLYSVLCGVGTMVQRNPALQQRAIQSGFKAITSKLLSNADAKVAAVSVQLVNLLKKTA